MKSFFIFLISLIIGIVIGISVTIIEPDFIKPYLSGFSIGKLNSIEGYVIMKQLEQDKLLLTVHAPQGATLATFDKKVSEIDLLVEKGDSITLSLRKYKPFIKNPIIKSVKKGGQIEKEEETELSPDASESSTDIEKVDDNTLETEKHEDEDVTVE